MRTYKSYSIVSLLRPVIFLAAISAALTSTEKAMGIEARIKDIARIAGLEEVELVGYGIVSGLAGTGDKDLALTKQTVANLMENFQISISSGDIKSKNVAAVAIIARVPPFHKANDRVDIKVSSLGDASSLEGGILMMTPLLDPNGEVYALAQGSLTVGGFSAGKEGAGGSTVAKNHVTTGIIPGGAVLKSSQSIKFCDNGILRLILRNPDFTTADRMAAAINKDLGGIAVAKDASTVSVNIPQDKLDIGQTAAFISKLERISLSPDIRAKVIVNERTGTIVMGGDVHISEAVVAHGNLTVSIKDKPRISELPETLIVAGANQTGIGPTVTPDVTTKVKEDKANVIVVPNITTVRELSDTLNMMGATPRDLISILEALRELGALQMELVSM